MFILLFPDDVVVSDLNKNDGKDRRICIPLFTPLYKYCMQVLSFAEGDVIDFSA